MYLPVPWRTPTSDQEGKTCVMENSSNRLPLGPATKRKKVAGAESPVTLIDTVKPAGGSQAMPPQLLK